MVDKKDMLEVINYVFDCFYDHAPNTKHLDAEFAEKIVKVEEILKRRSK